MIIEFTCKNCEIGESLKNFTEKRLSKLNKFFDEKDWQAKVLVRSNKYIFESEISVLHDGEWVKSKAKGNELEHAIIQAVDHLKTQLTKKIKKIKEKRRWEAHHGKKVIELAETYPERKFLRRHLTQYPLKTLDENEAIEEFNSSGKPFLIFRDAKSNTLKIAFEEKEKKIILDLGVE